MDFVDSNTYCDKCKKVVDFNKTYALKIVYTPDPYRNPFEILYACNSCYKDVGHKELIETNWSIREVVHYKRLDGGHYEARSSRAAEVEPDNVCEECREKC